jgi:hypothetical protein
LQVNNDTEDPLEVIVSSIKVVAEGLEKLNHAGLSRRAILLLLHDCTSVPKKQIALILDAAPLLLHRYLETDENDNDE